MGNKLGCITRLMGALIMVHSDDEGLVIPPKLAHIQVVCVPIYKTDEEFDAVISKLKEISFELKKKGIFVKIDDRDSYKPGFKFAEWEQKGIPVRLALGPRDLANDSIEVARRDLKTKEVVGINNLSKHVLNLLDNIQQNLYKRALEYRNNKSYVVNQWDDFLDVINVKKGFAIAHWDGTAETEEAIKNATKATIRCIPLVDDYNETGNCVYSGKPSNRRVIFAKSY